MPCSDGGYPYPDTEKAKLKERLDEVTQNLCYLCGNLQRIGALEDYANSRILAWWAQHDAADCKRVHEQMMKAFRRMPAVAVEVVAAQFIEAAEAVHPVSSYHREWFLTRAIEAASAVAKENAESIRRTQLAQDAMAKLTAEERAALGVEGRKA
jgi:hypothetical protein